MPTFEWLGKERIVAHFLGTMTTGFNHTGFNATDKCRNTLFRHMISRMHTLLHPSKNHDFTKIVKLYRPAAAYMADLLSFNFSAASQRRRERKKAVTRAEQSSARTPVTTVARG